MAQPDIDSALRELARDRGVFRDDLTQALNGKLRELSRCWSIHLAGQSLKDVRKLVIGNLKSLTDQLETRPAKQVKITAEQREEQYWHAIRVYFNLPFYDKRDEYPQEVYEPLWEMNLTQRRNWLDNDARGHLKLAVATGQDDLDYAVKKIAQMILAAGYAPLVPDSTPSSDGSDTQSRSTDLVPQPQEPNNPPPNSRQPMRSHLRVALAAIAAFGLLFAGAAVYDIFFTSSAPSAPAASVDPSKLTVTVLSAVDGESGSSVVFPSATSAAAEYYLGLSSLSQAPMIGTPPSVFLGELKAGGYALGGLDLTFNIESTSASTITVYDVRPVFKARKAPLAGAAIYWPGQGGYTSAQMYFDMDNLVPVAKSLSKPFKVDGPFFTTQAITVGANNTEEIEAYLEAYEGAYTFDLAIDYELNGKKYTQTFALDGNVPFAITADQCGNSDPETGTVVVPSRTGAYQAAHTVDLNPDDGGKMLNVTPPNRCTDR